MTELTTCIRDPIEVLLFFIIFIRILKTTKLIFSTKNPKKNAFSLSSGFNAIRLFTTVIYVGRFTNKKNFCVILKTA